MSKNAFKVNKVLHLRPQDSLPADPENGDLVYQGDTIWFRVDGAWFDATATLSDPMTTRGDMIIRDSANTLNRLPVGAAGQVLKSDGLDVEWGDESAAGGKNYVLNPDAAIDTTNVTGDAGFTVARTTTASELPEESKGHAFKISGSGLTPDSSKVAWAITASGVDDADGGRMGHWEVRVQDISTTISGEYKLQVYNVTDAAYVGDSTEVTSTGTYKGSVPLNGAADYELHLIALVAAPTDIGISGVTISAESVLIGGLITEWQDAGISAGDISGFGTVSDIRIERKIVGTDIYLRGEFRSGTPTASEAQIGLGGYTIDSPTQVTDFIVGFAGRDASNVQIALPVLATDGDTYLNVGLSRHDTSNNIVTPANGNSLIGASQFLKFSAGPIPVAELNGSVMFGTEAQAQNARARFVSENESVAASSAVGFNQGNEFNSGTFTNSSGQIGVPAEGYYDLNFMFEIPSDTSGDLLFEFRKNGSKIAPQMGQPSTSDAENRCASGSTDVYLTTSDYIEVVNLAGFARTSDAVYGGVLTVTRNPDKSSNATGFPFADQFPGEYGMVKYQSDVVNLAGDFNGGSLKITKIEDQVLISVKEATTSSGNSAPAYAGVIPTWARPAQTMRNEITVHAGSYSQILEVQSTGLFVIRYYTSNGTGAARTSGENGSISYNIGDGF